MGTYSESLECVACFQKEARIEEVLRGVYIEGVLKACLRKSLLDICSA